MAKRLLCKKCPNLRDISSASALCKDCQVQRRKRETEKAAIRRLNWSSEERSVYNAKTLSRNKARYHTDPIWRRKVLDFAIEYQKDPAVKLQTRCQKYNISIEQYTSLLTAQNNSCAICKKGDPGTSGSWHIDHDHRCCPEKNRSCGKCVRGLLCHYCNIGLGHFFESLAFLDSAASYLSRSVKETA